MNNTMTRKESREAYYNFAAVAIQHEKSDSWLDAANYWKQAQRFAMSDENITYCAKRRQFCQHMARAAHNRSKK